MFGSRKRSMVSVCNGFRDSSSIYDEDQESLTIKKLKLEVEAFKEQNYQLTDKLKQRNSDLRKANNRLDRYYSLIAETTIRLRQERKEIFNQVRTLRDDIDKKMTRLIDYLKREVNEQLQPLSASVRHAPAMRTIDLDTIIEERSDTLSRASSSSVQRSSRRRRRHSLSVPQTVPVVENNESDSGFSILGVRVNDDRNVSGKLSTTTETSSHHSKNSLGVNSNDFVQSSELKRTSTSILDRTVSFNGSENEFVSCIGFSDEYNNIPKAPTVDEDDLIEHNLTAAQFKHMRSVIVNVEMYKPTELEIQTYDRTFSVEN